MKVYFLYLIILITTNAQLFCADYTVKIEDTLKRDLSQKTNLLGTNLALWTSKDFLGNKTLEDYVRQLGISDIRIPGGSWTNEYYWNGNGVRTQEAFDLSKQSKEGCPALYVRILAQYDPLSLSLCGRAAGAPICPPAEGS